MGCDIHLIVERRVNEKWERVDRLPPRACSWCDGRGHYENRPDAKCYWCVESGIGKPGDDCRPYHDRNYTVFSVLANVRNDGYVTPISEPRGMPDDATHATGKDKYGDEIDSYEHGDHSFSWLTLAELLAYNWKQEIKDEGWVDAETFKKWDAAGAKGMPESWSASVGGGMVKHVSNSEMRRRIKRPYGWEANDSPYTLLQWTVPPMDYCKYFLGFVEVLQSLGKPDDVRIVFGFDS